MEMKQKPVLKMAGARKYFIIVSCIEVMTVHGDADESDIIAPGHRMDYTMDRFV